MIEGRCECGSVRFKVEKVRETVTVCHCSQCRRTSGHLWASTHAPFDMLKFDAQNGLKWYSSSADAQRGFCKECGSSLFYRMNGEDGIGIAVGCLDQTEGLHIGKHIFTDDSGTYYDVPKDAPTFPKG